MGFSQYPDNIVTSIYVSDEIQISDINPNDDTQLAYFGIQLFKHGPNTDVKLYMKAYTTGDVLLQTSEAINVDQFPTETDYFYGWVYFKFDPRVTLPSATPVRFKLALTGYTFSETDWIGPIYDWPVTMGYNGTPDQIDESPFAIDVIGAS